MHLIVYTSELTQPLENIDSILIDIVDISKIKNAQEYITGLLFYHNSRFVQFIEGPQVALEKLMQTLSNDIRHTNIVRIIDEVVYVRSFSGWAMDSFNLNHDDVMTVAELTAIRDVYKRNVNVISSVLALFYKQMLASKKE